MLKNVEIQKKITTLGADKTRTKRGQKNGIWDLVPPNKTRTKPVQNRTEAVLVRRHRSPGSETKEEQNEYRKRPFVFLFHRQKIDRKQRIGILSTRLHSKKRGNKALKKRKKWNGANIRKLTDYPCILTWSNGSQTRATLSQALRTRSGATARAATVWELYRDNGKPSGAAPGDIFLTGIAAAPVNRREYSKATITEAEKLCGIYTAILNDREDGEACTL